MTEPQAATAVRIAAGGSSVPEGVPEALAYAHKTDDGGWALEVIRCPYCGGGHTESGGSGPEPALGLSGCGGRSYKLVRIMYEELPWAVVKVRRDRAWWVLTVADCPHCHQKHLHFWRGDKERPSGAWGVCRSNCRDAGKRWVYRVRVA